jgi:hypothetical protein
VDDFVSSPSSGIWLEFLGAGRSLSGALDHWGGLEIILPTRQTFKIYLLGWITTKRIQVLVVGTSSRVHSAVHSDDIAVVRWSSRPLVDFLLVAVFPSFSRFHSKK